MRIVLLWIAQLRSFCESLSSLNNHMECLCVFPVFFTAMACETNAMGPGTGVTNVFRAGASVLRQVC